MCKVNSQNLPIKCGSRRVLASSLMPKAIPDVEEPLFPQNISTSGSISVQLWSPYTVNSTPTVKTSSGKNLATRLCKNAKLEAFIRIQINIKEKYPKQSKAIVAFC